MPDDLLWTPRHKKTVWLPGGHGKKLKTEPRTEKDHLLKELETLGYFMPGAEDEEVSYLRDIVARCRDKKRRQDELDEKAGREIVNRLNSKEIQGLIREFMHWRTKREAAQGLRTKESIVRASS